MCALPCASLFPTQVKDRETGNSRGTAFVMYREPAAAAAAIEAGATQGPGAKPLTLHGRSLVVCEAMDRESAKQAREQTRGAQRWDRRHLYLASEGAVGDDVEIPATDKRKRDRAKADNKQKLRSPIFFVSPTKLSVRNLGRHVADVDLRNLFRKVCTLCGVGGSDGSAPSWRRLGSRCS